MNYTQVSFWAVRKICEVNSLCKSQWLVFASPSLDSSWNKMAHGDAREGKWRGNWRMVWVASILSTTSERVSSITTADAHNSAASSRLNWRPRRFKWTRPFCRKTKSGFSACAITFQLTCTIQIIYFLPTESTYVFFFNGSQNKQRLPSSTALTDWVIHRERVYCAVQTEFLNRIQYNFLLRRVR